MNFRALRRRLSPAWLQSKNIRRTQRLLINKLGYRRTHLPLTLHRHPELMNSSPLRFVVAEQLLRNPDFTFLQIGANDGVTADELHETVVCYNLRGVLVEPQSAAIALLRETYRDHPQLTILQAAIAEEERTRELYSVRGEASVLASFDRGHLIRHGIADDRIVAEPVACHTVESALRAAGLDHVDLIQIDAEGYDYEIIRSIDLERLQPAILRFEYRHMKTADKNHCIELLANQGYRFLAEEGDLIAYRSGDARMAAKPGPQTTSPQQTSQPSMDDLSAA